MKNEWIDTEIRKPSSSWHIVLVTDGNIVSLARWIEDPKDWYGEDLLDYNEETGLEEELEKEWHESHWIFETGIGPFKGNDECFIVSRFITHWMDIPLPPDIKPHADMDSHAS